MRRAFLAVVICLPAYAAANAQQRPPAQQRQPDTQLQQGLSAQVQPLNVKTGQWALTETSTVNATIPPELQARLSQLPPEARAALQSRFGGTPHTSTYNSCITAADLAKMQFGGPNERCSWTTLTSTGTDMQARGTACRAGGNNNGTTADATVSIHVIDSENATGSVQVNLVGNGQTMNSSATFTGKWVSATCAK